MATQHADEYRDPALARAIAEQISRRSRRPLRLMEVCGTHTVAIFRHGIRNLLPPSLSLISGPGCPVCVTAQREIDAFIAYARKEDTIVATFGDLLRVPGTESSLQKERAAGKDIRVVYSTFDALRVARENPDRQVVFLGVGFETTAPTVAAAIHAARAEGIRNFTVLSAHKTVPAALEALTASEDVAVDGFLLPGHVSVIIGLQGYAGFFERRGIPSVVAGFEPVDLLQAIDQLVAQAESGKARLANAYPRAVSESGNPKAVQLIERVFEPVDAVWRGIGVIPESGLAIREEFADHDAARRFPVSVPAAGDPAGCACGDILKGTRIPPECRLFRQVCTPMNPVGPCMVSSEGTCAAYYRYHREDDPR
ncbi:MAG: hydrogenase formation protein HypD [Desulfobacterales bacterium]